MSYLSWHKIFQLNKYFNNFDRKTNRLSAYFLMSYYCPSIYFTLSSESVSDVEYETFSTD